MLLICLVLCLTALLVTGPQASGVFLSDIPRYDLSSDYILLAEQRQAEADLKDKFERLTLELQVRFNLGELWAWESCGLGFSCV